MYWKVIYVVLWAVYPALFCLRYCDSNTPAMDKVYLLLHRTCLAIKRSAQSLEDDNLFTPSALDEVGTDLYDKDAHMYEGREVNYVRDG